MKVRRMLATGLAAAALGSALVIPQTPVAASATTHAFGGIEPTTRINAPASGAAALTIAGAVASSSPASNLPASADLTPWSVPIGNQGAISSCATWAINYALLGWYSNYWGHAGVPFAPMYTYSQIHLTNDADGGGSRQADALTYAAVQGTAAQIDYAHSATDFTTKPTAGERAAAYQHRISGYQTLFSGANQGSGATTVLKALLAANIPVSIGLRVRPGFDDLGPGAATVDDDTTGEILGRHAVLAVGYNASGLLVQNSWGTGWGNRGFGRISWNVVEKDVSEANVINGAFATGFADSLQMVLDTAGDVWAKKSIGNGGWVRETIGSGVTSMATNNGLQMIVDRNGDVWAKNTPIGSFGWIKESEGSHITKVATGNGIQMALDASGNVAAKSGPLGTMGWTQELVGRNVTSIATGNGVQMVLSANGSVSAKNGALGTDGWTLETNGPIKAIATDNGLQLALNTAGDIWARNDIGFNGWTQETVGSGITAIATGNGVQMALDDKGDVAAKTGPLGTTGWTQETLGSNVTSMSTDNGVQMVLSANGNVAAKGTFGNLGTSGWNLEATGSHRTVVTG